MAPRIACICILLLHRIYGMDHLTISLDANNTIEEHQLAINEALLHPKMKDIIDLRKYLDFSLHDALYLQNSYAEIKKTLEYYSVSPPTSDALPDQLTRLCPAEIIFNMHGAPANPQEKCISLVNNLIKVSPGKNTTGRIYEHLITYVSYELLVGTCDASLATFLVKDAPGVRKDLINGGIRHLKNKTVGSIQLDDSFVRQKLLYRYKNFGKDDLLLVTYINYCSYILHKQYITTDELDNDVQYDQELKAILHTVHEKQYPKIAVNSLSGTGLCSLSPEQASLYPKLKMLMDIRKKLILDPYAPVTLDHLNINELREGITLLMAARGSPWYDDAIHKLTWDHTSHEHLTSHEIIRNIATTPGQAAALLLKNFMPDSINKFGIVLIKYFATALYDGTIKLLEEIPYTLRCHDEIMRRISYEFKLIASTSPLLQRHSTLKLHS